MMNEAFLRRRASDEFESAAAALLGDAERGIIIVDWFARSRPMFVYLGTRGRLGSESAQAAN